MQLTDVNETNTKNIVNDSMKIVSETLKKEKVKQIMNKLPSDVYDHSIDVAFYSVMLAKLLEDLITVDLEKLSTSALLHDIGKLEIPFEILNKPGRLTNSEYEIVKQHTVIGYKIASNEHFSGDICNAILSHHENEDCTGYPYGTDKISLYSKIIHICDVYSALISKRCYKEAWTIEESLLELQKEKGNFCITLLIKFKELIIDVYGINDNKSYSKVYV